MYFGTFARAMFTMFECTLGNYGPIARALIENVSPWFMVGCLIHKLFIGFAILGVINGVFIQETFKVASYDDHILLMQKKRAGQIHAQKMAAFFKVADTSDDGYIDQEEFRAVLGNDQVRGWLAAQGLESSDADKLFMLLDRGDHVLSVQDVAEGMSKLKGTARSVDMALVLDTLLRVTDHLLPLESEVKQIQRALAQQGVVTLEPIAARPSLMRWDTFHAPSLKNNRGSFAAGAL